MAKRSISDEEISLIKAMLARGMKNRDIQFYFNRQDRPANSGRITQIRNGSYGPDVIQSTEDALNSFLSSFKPTEIGVLIKNEIPRIEPSKAERAKALFEKQASGSWRLKDGETDEHECKQDFDAKKLSPVLCAIAAMSNNRGGFLFLGVSNSNCEAVGVSEAFENFDIAKLMDKVKTHLAPTPIITTKTLIDLDGIRIGLIHVEPHPYKPVIVCKDDGEKLKEGEILFRYAGQSSRIKYTDLRELLIERDRKSQFALANAAGKLAAVGTANALILDTDKNVLDAGGHEILIDEELAKSINFIREGHFDEVDGAPTLKLIGEVKPINIQGKVAEKLVEKAISQEEILRAFLNQEKVPSPKEYIRAAVTQPRKWLPLFYFARIAEIKPSEMAEEIVLLPTSQKKKRQAIADRLNGKTNSFGAAPTKKAKALVREIETGKIPEITNVEDANIFSQAVTEISNTTASLAQMLSALKLSLEVTSDANDAPALGYVFKAACRVDEIFFKP